MNKTLLNLLSQLNESKLKYAIGGSMMLKLRKYDVLPKDLDIMVSEADFYLVIELFQTIGLSIEKPSLPSFKTKNFASFQIGDMSVDIMAGFAYEHIEGIYYAIFDSLSITDHVDVEGHLLPLMSLEEWYIMYMVMNRKNKVKMIEDIWKKQDVDYPHLLERQLSLNLPLTVKRRIYSILKKKEVSFN